MNEIFLRTIFADITLCNVKAENEGSKNDERNPVPPLLGFLKKYASLVRKNRCTGLPQQIRKNCPQNIFSLKNALVLPKIRKNLDTNKQKL